MSTENILLITSRADQLHDFAEEVRNASGTRLILASSRRDALDTLGRDAVVLAIVDDRVGKETGLEIVRHLIQVNAFIQTAVLSAEDDATFHEVSEGLGVLVRLPMQPDAEDARRLLDRLRQVA